MIEPPPARRMAGIWCLQPRNTPLRFTAMVVSQTPSSVDSASPSALSMIPALLKATCRAP